MYQNEPLAPLCQFNLTEAPFVPEILRDISLITIFIAEDFYGGETIQARNRNDLSDWIWCLRSYAHIEDLVPLVPPNFASSVRPFEAQWLEAQTDYPTHDTMPIELPPDIDDRYYEIEGIETVNGTKLGGWPSCIQSEPWWDYRNEGKEFEYALQVDSEEKAGWMWGDAGAAYFARSKRDPNLWAFDWQCM